MQSEWVECLISFGSNLGDRKDNIDRAIKYLRNNRQIKIEKVSTIIETKPLAMVNQPKFLNGVLRINTNLTPQSLLKILNKIEEKLGRVRKGRYCARTIDLDILTFGNKKINDKNLKIPHPRMWKRKFVTIPLREIAPDLFKLKHR